MVIMNVLAHGNWKILIQVEDLVGLVPVLIYCRLRFVARCTHPKRVIGPP
jgi:hypothetical protein